MTALSDFIWPKKQIRARRGCCFMSRQPPSNVGEALALFARYSRIVNEAVRIKRAPTREGLIAEISFIGLSRHATKQVTEFGVGAMIKALREIAGRKIRPSHLSFLHARNSDLREFEAFFGCPVEFGASGDQVASRTRRWLSRWSPKIRTCLRRFGPFAMRLQKRAARQSGRYELRSRTRRTSCCPTVRPSDTGSPRH